VTRYGLIYALSGVLSWQNIRLRCYGHLRKGYAGLATRLFARLGRLLGCCAGTAVGAPGGSVEARAWRCVALAGPQARKPASTETWLASSVGKLQLTLLTSAWGGVMSADEAPIKDWSNGKYTRRVCSPNKQQLAGLRAGAIPIHYTLHPTPYTLHTLIPGDTRSYHLLMISKWEDER